MMIRATLELGNPELRQASAPVDAATGADTRATIEELRATLHDFRARNGWGRALAAPVIGVPLRLIVVEHDELSLVLINPAFERWSSEQVDGYESCITFPTLWGCVSRPYAVIVVAQDEAGVSRRVEAEGELARLLQHEIDHLDGLTWLDRGPDLETLCTTGEYQRRYRQR